MAAANALAVVRQIQALAEGPKNADMVAVLEQVAKSLLFFLDHPDSRVRQGSSRTLAKLGQNYPAEFQKLDLSKARAALERCKAAEAEGAEDEEAREFREALMAVLGEAPTEAEPALKEGGVSEGRGEVILKIGDATDAKVKGLILERTVKLSGVVSVTFEGHLIIVSTRTPGIAKEASFLADLLAFVKEQGLRGVSLVSAQAAISSAEAAGDRHEADDTEYPEDADGEVGGDNPAYLESDDEDEGRAKPKRKNSWGDVKLGPAAETAAATSFVGLSLLQQQQGPYSFFAQNQFGAGRRLQEFGDDPSIAARLAAAKRKEAERAKENESRLGKLSAWFTGGR